MRPIDADVLKRELMKAFNCENATKYGNKDAKQQEHSYSTIMLYEVSEVIEDTIDNAPTVERPKGKWILKEPDCDDGGNNLYECTHCHHSDTHSGSIEVPYCWYCGADMREADDDDEGMA